MDIKVIAFDMDGTLFPDHPLFIRMAFWAIKHRKQLRVFQKVRKELRKESTFVKKTADTESFYWRQAVKYGEGLGLTKEAAYKEINELFYPKWEEIIHKAKLFSGLVEFLKELKERGFKIALLSDFPVGNRLKTLKIEEFFDYALSSEQTGFLKPHPTSFLTLAEKMKVVPEKVLYVGNRYDYDVLGANSAGMKTALITNKSQKGGKIMYPTADIIFKNYNQLRRELFY